MEYRKEQPFNDNHLRSCPLLDNPGSLVELVNISGAHSTDLQNPENVLDLYNKCIQSAEQWGLVADGLWNCSSHCESCH